MGGRNIILVMCLLALFVAFATAEEITVVATVSTTEVYRGEEIAYQVQVSGSDMPEKPDTSVIEDFDVLFEGGQTTNSESVTIINGRSTRTTYRGYVFYYRLVSLKDGLLTVPPVSVIVEGRVYSTEAVKVRVKVPEQTDDYKLRLSVSKDTAFVGETITLVVTWLWPPEKPARTLSSFALPVVDSDAFEVLPFSPENPDGADVYKIPVHGEDTAAIQGKETLDGRRYTTLTFHKTLIPRQAGAITIPSATVVFEAVTGTERFQDFFGRTGTREVTGKFVIPSNSISIAAVDLPTIGRPPDFSGLVGDFRITASAERTEVSVGDPITLTVRVAGTGYLGKYRLPSLRTNRFMALDFRIPAERASVQWEGPDQVYTQTIRANRSGVDEIPPLELAYFNPDTKTYETAMSERIPLVVKETDVVTIDDVEGVAPTELKNEVVERSEGIAYSYEDLSVIEDQAYGVSALLRPAKAVWLAIGPIAFLGVLLFRNVKNDRRKRSAERDERRALRTLIRDVESTERSLYSAENYVNEIFAAFKRYLGIRAQKSAATMTYQDIMPGLLELGVGDSLLIQVHEIFKTCEAGHYGGLATDTDERLAGRVIAVARELEGAKR